MNGVTVDQLLWKPACGTWLRDIPGSFNHSTLRVEPRR